jgi:hypothetical protein
MNDTIDPPDDDDGQGEKPSNPFDPPRLRTAGGRSQGPTAKRILTSIQIRGPSRRQHFSTPLTGAVAPQTGGGGR